MKRVIFLFLLYFSCSIVFCQIPNQTRQKAVDSLFNLLPMAEGTTKADLLNHLSLQLAPRSFDSSFRFATEALQLSEKLEYPRGEGMATFNIGNSYYFKSDIKNALTNYLSALRMLEPFEPAREIGDLLLMLGSINEYVRNTEKMFDYYNRAVRNFLAASDTSAAMLVYMTLGCAYGYKLQTLAQIDSLSIEEVNMMMDSAIAYNNMALDYYLIPHVDYKWAPVEVWLTNIYNYHGCYYQAKGDSLALFYYLKAFEQSRAIKDTISRNFLEGLMCANLGYNYYFQMNYPDKGYKYAKEAIELLKKTGRYDIYAGSLSILGQIELDQGRFGRAEMYLLRALNVSDTFLLKIDQIDEPDPTIRLWSVTQIRSQRVIMFSHLVRLFELTGDLKNALLYQKKLEEGKSLQSQDELTRQIIGQQADHEDELKRQEISSLVKDNEFRRLKLNQTRILLVSVSCIFLIILLIVVLWIQHKRYRADHKALVLEQKLLRSQMNPHFIFNSLASIQNFILNQQADNASIFLTRFSKLLRNVLDNSAQEYVPLEKEISTIENYLALQKIRFGNKFEYAIDVDDALDPESVMIPPMLAQPFIENSIEHGIKHKKNIGHINIQFKQVGNMIHFEVEDDGVGREKAREVEIQQQKDHLSMATSITRERLVNLNKKLKKKISLDIIDLFTESGEACGTKVMFGIPIASR
ncbi:MAG: histidine kinase [Bacteroidetes bacterium]|nr:histidine kinase [Bacteroidota bacterium]